jgi:hypothetical protein
MHAEAAGSCGTQRPAPEGTGPLWCIMLRRCAGSVRLFVPPRLSQAHLRNAGLVRTCSDEPLGSASPIGAAGRPPR